MGRTYAGVLGGLAFFVSLTRGAMHAGSVETTVFEATLCLCLFAAVGCLLGQTAAWIVDDSVRARLAAEMALATAAAASKAASAANNKNNPAAVTKPNATQINKTNSPAPAKK